MAEKIIDKVIAKGIVKRKSEDEGDLEIKQNFVLDDLEELYREKMSEVIFQELEVKEGYEFEVLKGLTYAIDMISFEYTAPEQVQNTIDFFIISLVHVKKHFIFASAKAMVP